MCAEQEWDVGDSDVVRIDIAKLNHFRAILGWSQKTLAIQCGIGTSTIERLYKKSGDRIKCLSYSTYAMLLDGVQQAVIARAKRLALPSGSYDFPHTLELRSRSTLTDVAPNSDQGGVGVATLVKYLEMNLPHEELETLGMERIQTIQEEIRKRLRGDAPPDIYGFGDGSVKITLALSPEEAEKLKSLIDDGFLRELGVMSAQIVDEPRSDMGPLWDDGVEEADKQFEATAERAVPDEILAEWRNNPEIHARLRSLISSLQDSDARKVTIGRLEKSLSDPDVIEKYFSADALALIKEESSDVISSLVTVAGNDPDRGMRRRCLRALGLLGSVSILPLLDLLGHSDPDVRWQVVRTISDIGDPSPTFEQWLHILLADPDLVVFLTAVSAAQKAGVSVVAAIPRLVTLTEDPSPGMRARVVRAIGLLRRDDIDATVRAALFRAKIDEVREVRQDSAHALSLLHIDMAAEEYASEVISFMRTQLPALKERSGRGTLIVPERDHVWLSIVIRAASSGSQPLSSDAELILSSIMEAYVPHVRYQLERGWGNDAEMLLREFKTFALPCVAEVLKDGSPAVRQRMIRQLGRSGRDLAAAISLLVPLLDDEHEVVRCEALEAILRLQSDFPLPMRYIASAVRHDSPMIREAVLRLLARNIHEALPYLSRALSDLKTARSIAYALEELGSQAQASVPLLIEMLDPRFNNHVRIPAVKALGNIGAAARQALPRLKELSIQTSNATLCALVLRAVASIERP